MPKSTFVVSLVLALVVGAIGGYATSELSGEEIGAIGGERLVAFYNEAGTEVIDGIEIKTAYNSYLPIVGGPAVEIVGSDAVYLETPCWPITESYISSETAVEVFSIDDPLIEQAVPPEVRNLVRALFALGVPINSVLLDFEVGLILPDLVSQQRAEEIRSKMIEVIVADGWCRGQHFGQTGDPGGTDA